MSETFLRIALLASILGSVQAAESVVPNGGRPGVQERGLQSPSSTNKLGGAHEEKLRLKLNSLPRTVHGDIQISTIVVVAESNKFSFLPPHGWQVESDARQKRIQLFRTENGSRITVDIIEDSSGSNSKPSAEILSQRTLARFPGARVVEEIQLSALGNVGPALDLDWRAPSGARRRTRTGLIPFPGGHLDCALTSSPDHAMRDCQSLNQFLLSLHRAALGGSLDLPIVTPE